MAYTPSPFRVRKYGKYLSYYMEFLKRGDFQSVSSAVKYVLFKQLPAKPRIATTPMGTFRFRAGTTDFQFANFSYESGIKQHLMQHIHQIGLFIDIGACIGEYCIWLSRQGVRSIAIEPVNHQAILDNIALNNLSPEMIQVLNCAVGKENKKVSFFVPEGVSSSSHINVADAGGNIDCKRLDDIIDISAIDQQKQTVIKMDVEGMEVEALQGASQLIKQVKNLSIIYEYTFCGDQAFRTVLDQYGRFTYRDLDGVNALAVKA
jgi:FkbM family methyltransferase